MLLIYFLQYQTPVIHVFTVEDLSIWDILKIYNYLVSYSSKFPSVLPSWVTCDRSVMILEICFRLCRGAGVPRGIAGFSAKKMVLWGKIWTNIEKNNSLDLNIDSSDIFCDDKHTESDLLCHKRQKECLKAQTIHIAKPCLIKIKTKEQVICKLRNYGKHFT